MSTPGTWQLPCGSRKGLRHSRVSGLLEEKLITISRLKSDQIKRRLELLRSKLAHLS